jgi:hypothetical protein
LSEYKVFRLLYLTHPQSKQPLPLLDTTPLAPRTPLERTLIFQLLRRSTVAACARKIFLSAPTEVQELVVLKKAIQFAPYRLVPITLLCPECPLPALVQNLRFGTLFDDLSNEAWCDHLKNVRLRLYSQVKGDWSQAPKKMALRRPLRALGAIWAAAARISVHRRS